jgi:hypothetical protein
MAILSALLAVVAPGLFGATLPSYPERLFDGDPIVGMVAGDFDGDGDQDVLLQRQAYVFLMANHGGAGLEHRGIFDARPWLPDSENPDYHLRSLVGGDLDGNGIPDAAILSAGESGNGEIRILRSDGGEGFETRSISSFPSFQHFTSMAAADLDGDGAEDLLICARNFSDSRMRLFSIREVLGAQPVVSELPPPPGEPFSAVYARGSPGRILAAAPGAVYAAAIDAAGSPGGWIEIPSFAPYSYCVRAGDIDGDGNDEAILWGTGALAVGSPEDGSVREIHEGEAIADISMLPKGLAIADGSYDALVHVDLSGGLDDPRKTVYSAGGVPQRIAAGDFDGDGRADLAVGLHRELLHGCDLQDSVVVASGAAGGGFRLPRNHAPGAIAIRDIEPADIDKDGDLDLVVAGHDDLAVLERKGGGWAEHQWIRAGAPLGGLRIADLDGDGLLDIVAAGSLQDLPVGESVWVFRAASPLTFADPPAGYAVGPHPVMVEIGDIDRNGIPDIAAAVYGPPGSPGNESHLAILLGKGDGTFADALKHPAGEYADGLILADLDGDSALDALLPSTRLDWEGLIKFEGKGDGGFGEGEDLDDLYGHLVLHADADGDGEREIVLAGKELSICEASLAGLAAPVRMPLPGFPSAIAVGDADGDGIPDILAVAHPSESYPDDRMLRFGGQGGGVFGEGVAVLTGNGTRCMEVAALGAGEEPVLVVAGTRTCSRTSFLVTLPRDPTAPPRFIRGDANGDGPIDLSDAISTLLFLFAGGAVACADAADANDDGALDISDPIDVLFYLFAGGGQPAAPFPDPGIDPTADGLGC